jgi:hypothetical protein
MSESKESSWPFAELQQGEGLDIDAIFGGGSAQQPGADPFAESPQEPKPEPDTDSISAPAQSQATAAGDPATQTPLEKQEDHPTGNPLEAAFAAQTTENARKGLFEKPPIFYHKGAKEQIEDPSMTFEELRIRKSEDFADLEEGKYVSWTVEYGGIRKEIKDPKGTTIISVKETIERSREFLEALKKAKDKSPDCLVKPKVVMKNKGVAAYKGTFRSVADARASDKVICMIPSADGKIYELRKTEQGEFIAPKHNVTELETVRAGFIPALPLIPMSLMGQIISFFRSFMRKYEEYEALVLIYWDKEEQRFFAYVPKQTVRKEHVEADLRECPYDDEQRYIRYADIHSHNSMEAFFSGVDDRDERGTGLYLVLGQLDHFYPEIKARISCGGSFVDLDPATVIEGLEERHPDDWGLNVTCAKRQSAIGKFSPLDRVIERTKA